MPAIIADGELQSVVCSEQIGDLFVCMSSAKKREFVLPKVRVSKAEYDAAIAKSNDASSFAHYIRELLCNTEDKSKKPREKKYKKVITKKITEFEGRQLDELHGLANNVNQIAKACNRARLNGDLIDVTSLYELLAKLESEFLAYISEVKQVKNDH